MELNFRSPQSSAASRRDRREAIRQAVRWGGGEGTLFTAGLSGPKYILAMEEDEKDFHGRGWFESISK